MLGQKKNTEDRSLFSTICRSVLWIAAFFPWTPVVLALGLSAQTADGESLGQDKVPLTFQQVEVAIHDQVAAGQYWFHFRNDFETDVEIACEFALGNGELVEGFSYYNGDERIVGEVLEKQAAEEVYEALTGLQRDPGILEQVGDHFRFRVYPVQPGEVKPVDVRVLSPLETREGVVEYVIPKENLPAQDTVFSLLVDITDDLPIAEVETVGFEGLVKRVGPRHYRVVYEGKAVSFTGDLKIRYKLQTDDYAMRFVAHRDGTDEGTFMLMVTPKSVVEESEVIGRDIIFVIDISGSMSGQPLEQTKWALAYIIGELNPDDRFDVIAFDDQAQSMLGGLKRATQANLNEAARLVSELESRGGTNILGAMQKALDGFGSGRDSDRSRAVIFLTDGQGSNPASVIIGEVRKRDVGARVYSFGVGSGVNRPFLERLARENRGIATLVYDADNLEREMKRLYDRISMPLMMDLNIEFRGANVYTTYPTRLPDLYRDSEVVIFGRYRKSGKATVIVTGQLKGEEKGLSMEVDLPSREKKYPYVEKLWASRRIRHLNDTIRDQGGSEELVNEITRLGIVYNLVTEYTTFLAVPESLKTEDIKEKIRKGQRGYDRKLVDSIEGIKLSMVNIPPGDPVVSVDAPEDAVKVVAYFPFGLVKRMSYDEIRRQWSARFLVPRDIADGLYTIRVLIVHADGVPEWRDIDYFIDGTAPEFEADIPAVGLPGGLVDIEVDPFEPVAEVFAYVLNDPETRVDLELDLDSGRYMGDIQLPDQFPEGPVTIRIVVRDLARNRFEQDFDIWEADNDDLACLL